jgi:tetratricopeptide (TPR) repeat protein
MGAAVSSKERHVIPRWRDSGITAALGELDSAETNVRILDGAAESWNEKLTAWKANRQLAFAADLVGAAVTLGRFEEADDAASYVLSKEADATPSLQLVARRVLERFAISDVGEQPKFAVDSLSTSVHLARERLRHDPRNAIAWTDLARTYASLGCGGKAERAVGLAMALAQENRFVLRSAARLFLHLGDSERAHRVLRRSDIVTSDPWIVAAEIAAADIEGKTSRHIRRGRRFLSSGKFSPFHLGELASAIGSLELKSGNSKAAKKLFRAALIKPTENSLAQIEWASQQLRDFTLYPSYFDIPFSHEARALYSFAAGDWKRAVKESVDWFADEPFSSKSATLGSYIAAEHLDEFRLSQNIAEQGLIASPGHPTLLNNLAFAFASQGELRKATEALKRISFPNAPIQTQICYLATKGFIAFRSEDLGAGRAYYLNAIDLAKGVSLAKLRAHAAVNLAQEELRVGSNEALTAVLNAIELSRTNADDDLRGVLQRLQKIVVSRSDVLGDIDRIVEDVANLMKPSKTPLATLEPDVARRIPLM